MQAYVNEFPDQLSSAVASSIPEWTGQEVHLHWVFSLASELYCIAPQSVGSDPVAPVWRSG
jgi:hypothetical protein